MEKENLFESLSKIGVVVVIVFAASLKYIEDEPVSYRPQGKLRVESVAPQRLVSGQESTKDQIMVQGHSLFQPFYQNDAVPLENNYQLEAIFNEKDDVKKVNDAVTLWPFLVF